MESRIEPKFYSKNDAAVYLGVSRRTIERYIQFGRLKTRRIPQPEQFTEMLDKVLIAKSELDKLAECGIEI